MTHATDLGSRIGSFGKHHFHLFSTGADMTTAMTTRDLARAAFAALVITAPINTMTMADEIKRVSANGTELAYVELGKGEPVIFVHGRLQASRTRQRDSG
jgi:hypothetical protein